MIIMLITMRVMVMATTTMMMMVKMRTKMVTAQTIKMKGENDG